jgi:hypothetical protein
MAYDRFRELESVVRAPAVDHAFTYDYTISRSRTKILVGIPDSTKIAVDSYTSSLRSYFLLKLSYNLDHRLLYT